MRVYHLSSSPFNGGAARAAFRLHQDLYRTGEVDSSWLDPGAKAEGEGVVALTPRSRADRLTQRLKRRNWGKAIAKHFAETSPPSSNPVGWGGCDMLESLPPPDVWNLHWVSWFLDWEAMLPWMAKKAPIVWTLHDLNALQGFWHYEPIKADLNPQTVAWERRAVELKRRALSAIPEDRLTFVGPSKWMARSCQESDVTKGFAVSHIPYGLDIEVFRPRSRKAFRELFGIPAKVFIIGFIADDLTDPRKGFSQLQKALNQISDSADVHLVTVGRGRVTFEGVSHTHIGALNNDVLLSHFYSACDVFICPSLQDNLPNTVLESMACGAPVVGFGVGGIPDMINHGVNGYIVDQVGDSDSLFEAIEKLRRHQDLEGFRENARNQIVNLFSSVKQTSSYLELYRNLAL